MDEELWTGQVTSIGEGANVYITFVGNCDSKAPLGEGGSLRTDVRLYRTRTEHNYGVVL